MPDYLPIQLLHVSVDLFLIGKTEIPAPSGKILESMVVSVWFLDAAR
ncbi:MAG: hypothetical protein ACQEQU_08560 [Spirochaetota bacterium]